MTVRHYLHLTRFNTPVGSHLLFLPGAWSIAMASYSSAVPFYDALWYTGLFGIGSVVMRGAGCIINDMWDQKLDRLVYFICLINRWIEQKIDL
jgi:4-hydroxybenzoate polyprenyltransferase